MRTWLPPVVLVGFVAVLGLLPHARFSNEVGRVTYFKSAYDEDTYALWTFLGGGPALPSRLLAQSALRAALWAAAQNWDAAQIVADILFPALAALAAWLLSGQVTGLVRLRLLLVSGLLFGQELLSLGSAAVWNFESGRLNLSWLRASAGRFVPGLVPDYSTSYLSLFRTPEPQVTLIAFFAVVWALLRWFGGGPSGRGRLAFWLLGLAHVCLAFVNLFFAAAVIAWDGLLAAVLLLLGRRRAAAAAAGFGAAGFASVAVASLFYAGSGGARDAAAVLFRSHLLAVTPAAVLAGLCLLGLVMSRRSIPDDTRFAGAAACFGTVLVLTNQQVLSGRMISVRDWERYVDYPFLVLGLALWAASPGVVFRRLDGRVVKGAVVAALVLVAWLLVRAQERVYGFFLRQNQESLAMERALRRIAEPNVRETTLVLATPSLAPLLEFRMRGYLACQIDYTEIFNRRIASLEEMGGGPGLHGEFEGRLFEYFARLGKRPGEVAGLLAEEVNQRAGFYLGFLFSMKDYWYPLTDDRRVRQDDLRTRVPGVTTDYAAYLASEPAAWRRPAIVLTEEPPERRVAPAFWHERLVGQGSAGREGAGAVVVYAWLQTPGR